MRSTSNLLRARNNLCAGKYSTVSLVKLYRLRNHMFLVLVFSVTAFLSQYLLLISTEETDGITATLCGVIGRAVCADVSLGYSFRAISPPATARFQLAANQPCAPIRHLDLWYRQFRQR